MADLLQILKGTGVRPRGFFYVNGTLTDIDAAGVPTVTITRPDGTTIASGTVTKVAAMTGTYEFTLAPQAECTFLTLTWAGPIGGVTETIITYVEVLGNLPFTIPAFRALKVAGGASSGFPFAATATPLFTDQQIMDKRAEILDQMQQNLGFPPVPRFHRVTLDGTGGYCVFPTSGVLKDPRLLSVTVNGTVQPVGNYRFTAASELKAVSNYTYGTAFTAGLGNIVVELVHGWSRMMGKGSSIAMLWAAVELLPSGFSNEASVTTPEGVTYTYEPSGTDRKGFTHFTGIRAIDRYLNDWAEPLIGIA